MSKNLETLIEETKKQYLAKGIDLEQETAGDWGNKLNFWVNALSFLNKFRDESGFFDLEFATHNFTENQFSVICEMLKKLVADEPDLQREFKITYYTLTGKPQSKHLFEMLGAIEFEILNFGSYEVEYRQVDVQLWSSDVTQLASLIRKQKGLKGLKLASLTRSDEFSDAIATTLADAIRDNTNIEVLDLSWNNLSANGANTFGNVLSTHPSIHTLYLSECTKHDVSIAPLLAHLKPNPRLRQLHITPNKEMGIPGVNLIAEIISANHLTSLDLNSGFSAITAEGATILAAALSRNTSLVSLDVSYCHIGFEGISQILQACARKECKLEVLDLKRCNIEKAGSEDSKVGAEVAALLPHIPCLKRVSLADNQFNNPEVQKIASVAGSIPNLEILDVSLNQTYTGVEIDHDRRPRLPEHHNILLALADSAESNPKIQKIYLLEEFSQQLGYRPMIRIETSNLDKPSGGLVFYSWWINKDGSVEVDPLYFQTIDRIGKACLSNRQLAASAAPLQGQQTAAASPISGHLGERVAHLRAAIESANSSPDASPSIPSDTMQFAGPPNTIQLGSSRASVTSTASHATSSSSAAAHLEVVAPSTARHTS